MTNEKRISLIELDELSADEWPWPAEEEHRTVGSVVPPPVADKKASPPKLPPANPPPHPPRRAVPDVEGWPPPEGTVLLGKYRLEKILGKGGMGVIVVAQHLQLKQKVAIKFLHPAAMEDPEVVVRFQREARVLTQIQSEHVVRILDVGTLEKNEPYMVMEYLEGTDLSKAVKVRGPLPYIEAADYVVQACEPLAEAHLQNIIHRDLKPSNLYHARRADGSYTIKVIDFGISKIQSEGELSMTKTQAILGSPLYISPEQLRSAKDVDARSDIWAIGVILYKLLTGRPPFMADTIAQLCTMIIMNPPPRITEVRPDVPQGLEDVILRCIQKDPDQRFQTVAELAEALIPFCAPEAEAHESLTRIKRLFRNAAPRAVGFGGVALPIAKPAATSAQPPPLLIPVPTVTDGPAALTLAGAGLESPRPVEEPAGAKRRRTLVLAAGAAVLAFAAAALVLGRSPPAPPAAPPRVAEPELPPISPPTVTAAPTGSTAAPIAVPPSTAAAAPPPTAASPAATPDTPDTATRKPALPPVGPASSVPSPPPVRKPKAVDNSEFGDRK